MSGKVFANLSLLLSSCHLFSVKTLDICPLGLGGWMGRKHNLIAENCVLFGRYTEDVNLEDNLSDSSEGLLQRGK